MIEPKTNPRNNGEQSSTGSFRFEKQILNTSSIGVMITRISDGTILYANKAVGNLLGIASVDSIIGQPVPDFYWDPADRQRLLELFRNEGSVTSNETRARRANGNMIWVSISLQPFQFEGEQSLLAEIVDNTDRKRVEDAVKASQQKLSLLIDSSPLAVIEWNTNFEVVSWNPAAERIFGYSFEEAKGRHAAGLIVPPSTKPLLMMCGPTCLSKQAAPAPLMGMSQKTDVPLLVNGTTLHWLARMEQYSAFPLWWKM